MRQGNDEGITYGGIALVLLGCLTFMAVVGYMVADLYENPPSKKIEARVDADYEKDTAKLKEGTVSQAVIGVGVDYDKTFEKLKNDGFKVVGTIAREGKTTGFIIEKVEKPSSGNNEG